MALWKIKKNNPNIPEELAEKFGGAAAVLLANRGINTADEAGSFFAPEYEKEMLDPFLFSEMPKVIARLETALRRKEKVAVYGDYDADGVTSCVILKETLEKIGLSCGVYIPDKKKEGYGLNSEALKKLAAEKVSLIFTVDCGISNAQEVEEARKMGIDVIVVDHHHVPEKYPEALAIINPKMKNCGYPFANLAGVGVALKVAQAVYRKFMEKEMEQSKWLLDLAAVGTVADSVPLTGENRSIVKFGQIVLSKTRRIGFQEMFKVGRIRVDEDNFPDERKIAFQISPRINAAGRMDHANAAFNLLVEENRARARTLALELEASNLKRQKETDRIFQEIKKLAEEKFKERKIILAVDEHYPIGIAGLVAGKITDEFGKPAVVLQKEDGVSRGSLRSVAGLNIIKILEDCSELLEKFGGHEQAAGLTIKNENLELFFDKIEKTVAAKKKDLGGEKIQEAECEIEARSLDFELARLIEKMRPFGEGNPEPLFILKNMRVAEIKKVGSNGKHCKMFLKPGDQAPKIFEAIWFNRGENFSLAENLLVDVLAKIELDRWNGNEKIVLNVVDIREIK